jgi:cell division control protein 6
MDGHYTDSIFKRKEVLSPNFIPDNLPNRIEEIKEIIRIIYEALEDKVTNILISGQPGTGKTASIKLIFKNLKVDTDALFCYVNCFNKSTRMGALYSMVLDFFKEKKPTRKMPSRRGIAYDELLDSFIKELEKTNTKVVVCLDEVDQLEETELIYDLIRARWNTGRIQVIGISNNPFIFKDLDPRTKSRLYPLREISFNPYTKEQMCEIVKARVEGAFHEDVVDKEAIDYLAEFTAQKKGDVRVARETLLRAGELARKSGDSKVGVKHIRERLNRTRHAKAICIINKLTKRERFILRLIPNKGTYYPQLYKFYKSTDGQLGDRMLRNYMEKFLKLKLINMERKGASGSYFITLNTPKNVLFEVS